MGGKSGGGGSQIVGYRYFLSLLMGICRGPVDALTEIRVGDRVAWSGSVTGNTQVEIAARNLFGGDDKEGGIDGPLAVHMGASTQILADGYASATITFDGQPTIGDTVTINGQVFAFVAALPPPDDGAGNDLGGSEGDGGDGGEAGGDTGG